MTEASAPHRDLEYYLNLSYPAQLTYQREDDDSYWIAEALDLPGCMSDGASPSEAIENLEDAKQLWIETQIEDGLEVPEPTQTKNYSGKFLVRMPKSLHRRLAEQAKYDGVSLNHYVVSLLSQGESTREQIRRLQSSMSEIAKEVRANRRLLTTPAHGVSALGARGANVVDAVIDPGSYFARTYRATGYSDEIDEELHRSGGNIFFYGVGSKESQIQAYVGRGSRNRERGEEVFVTDGTSQMAGRTLISNALRPRHPDSVNISSE